MRGTSTSGAEEQDHTQGHVQAWHLKQGDAGSAHAQSKQQHGRSSPVAARQHVHWQQHALSLHDVPQHRRGFGTTCWMQQHRALTTRSWDSSMRPRLVPTMVPSFITSTLGASMPTGLLEGVDGAALGAIRPEGQGDRSSLRGRFQEGDPWPRFGYRVRCGTAAATSACSMGGAFLAAQTPDMSMSSLLFSARRWRRALGLWYVATSPRASAMLGARDSTRVARNAAACGGTSHRSVVLT